MSDIDELGDHLGGLADSLRGRVVDRLAGAAALAYKTEGIDEARKRIGTDLRLSRYGTSRTRAGGGRKVTVRYPDPVRGATVVAFQPKAIMAILETGARPHQIGGARRTKSGRYIGGRRRRPKRLNIGGRWVTGPVRHPGARGRHTYTTALRNARPKARDAVADELATILRG